MKLRGNIEKEIDLKLSGLELNETINKKKFALQQKMLNEEISKRLSLNKTNKQVKSDNPKINFSNVLSVIKGKK